MIGRRSFLSLFGLAPAAIAARALPAAPAPRLFSGLATLAEPMQFSALPATLISAGSISHDSIAYGSIRADKLPVGSICADAVESGYQGYALEELQLYEAPAAAPDVRLPWCPPGYAERPPCST